MWDSKIHLSIPRSRPNMSAFIKGRTSESAFCDPCTYTASKSGSIVGKRGRHSFRYYGIQQTLSEEILYITQEAAVDPDDAQNCYHITEDSAALSLWCEA